MAGYWSWVLVLGAITMLGGVLASRLCRAGAPAPPTVPLSRLSAGIALAVIAFLLCLPGRFPFSTGQQLGYGVLLGLAAALIALIAIWLARPSEDFAPRIAASAAAGGAAAIWVGVVQLLFHGDPTYALLGGVAGGLLAVLPLAWDRERAELAAFGGALLLAGLGSLLAIEHYRLASERALWALPVVPLAAGLLGAVVGVLLFGRSRAARWGTVATVILLEAAACLGSRALLHSEPHLTAPPSFVYLPILGWAALLLVAGASWANGRRPFSIIAPVLLAVTALIIAFNIAAGYGAALMLAVGLPIALLLGRRLLLPSQASGAPAWAIALGILYVAYRLYLATFEDSFRGGLMLGFGRHYVFVGLAAGLLWMGAARLANRTTSGFLAQGAVLALLPPLLFSVFGYEGLLGLVLGLWITQFSLPIWSSGEWQWRGLPSFYAPLATTWALIVPGWAEFMLDEPRWVRGLIVGGAVALLLIALALIRQPAGTSTHAAAGEDR